MPEFQKVAEVAEFSDPGKMVVEVDDQLVVVCRVGGEFYCIDDVCTHDGGPLGEGELRDHTLACPRHGAKFDIRDGRALTMPATQPTLVHHVKVENGEVYVRLNDGSKTVEHSANRAAPAEAAPKPYIPPSPAVATGSGAYQSLSAVAAPAKETSCDDNMAKAQAMTDAAMQAGESAAVETEQFLGPLSEERVMEQLKKVVDPELFVNIVDLGLIYVVTLAEAPEEQHDVQIEMTMTSPACPAGPQLIANSKSSVGQLPGVRNVEVKIVMDPPWTPDRMTEDARDQLGIF